MYIDVIIVFRKQMHSKVHYDSRYILGLVSACIDKFIDMLINQSTIRRTPKRDDCVTTLTYTPLYYRYSKISRWCKGAITLSFLPSKNSKMI